MYAHNKFAKKRAKKRYHRHIIYQAVATLVQFKENFMFEHRFTTSCYIV